MSGVAKMMLSMHLGLIAESQSGVRDWFRV